MKKPTVTTEVVSRFFWILGFFVLSQSIFAQSGSVRGRVKASGIEALAGARVVLSDSGATVLAETKSSSDGKYEFTLVPAGIYSLSVEGDGYVSRSQSAIQVKPETITFVDFRLIGVDEPTKKGSICNWRKD